jgi:hypothetical protein
MGLLCKQSTTAHCFIDKSTESATFATKQFRGSAATSVSYNLQGIHSNFNPIHCDVSV